MNNCCCKFSFQYFNEVRIFANVFSGFIPILSEVLQWFANLFFFSLSRNSQILEIVLVTSAPCIVLRELISIKWIEMNFARYPLLRLSHFRYFSSHQF